LRPTPQIYTLSLHDALPIWLLQDGIRQAEHHVSRSARYGARVRLDRWRAQEPRCGRVHDSVHAAEEGQLLEHGEHETRAGIDQVDRKSTRLNSSHVAISYAV